MVGSINMVGIINMAKIIKELLVLKWWRFSFVVFSLLEQGKLQRAKSSNAKKTCRASLAKVTHAQFLSLLLTFWSNLALQLFQTTWLFALLKIIFNLLKNWYKKPQIFVNGTSKLRRISNNPLKPPQIINSRAFLVIVYF